MRPSCISATEVCFGYAGSDVLHDITVEIRCGEVVAIAGPNGSGKSTLLELLAGVLTPRRGEIVRNGDLALVAQRPNAPATLPLTARDVVTIGTWKRPSRLPRAPVKSAVEDALVRVGMMDHAFRPLASLSGGQRQRVFLAQGIVSAPDILLFDEPAAGLDELSTTRMHSILTEEATRGAAVICVTHDQASISAADRTIRLEHGRLTAGVQPDPSKLSNIATGTR